MKKEKELYGDSILEELTTERDEILEEAAQANDIYAETITERDGAISKLMDQLEEVTMERESLLAQIKEEEEDQKLSDELQKEVDDIKLKAKTFENERDVLQQRLGEVVLSMQGTRTRKTAKVTKEKDMLASFT